MGEGDWNLTVKWVIIYLVAGLIFAHFFVGRSRKSGFFERWRDGERGAATAIYYIICTLFYPILIVVGVVLGVKKWKNR